MDQKSMTVKCCLKKMAWNMRSTGHRQLAMLTWQKNVRERSVGRSGFDLELSCADGELQWSSQYTAE